MSIIVGYKVPGARRVGGQGEGPTHVCLMTGTDHSIGLLAMGLRHGCICHAHRDGKL